MFYQTDLAKTFWGSISDGCDFHKIPKIPKFPGFTWSFHLNLDFSNFDIFRKHIFCFVQKHIEKIKIFKIKIYFSRLLILNRCVSNLQVPTTSGARWGKVNVSENPGKSRFSEKLAITDFKMVNKGVDTCKPLPLWISKGETWKSQQT